MSEKANIDLAARLFVYSLNGKAKWDGRSEELPKEHPQTAINGAADLLPPPSASAPTRVKEGQGAVFFGDIVLRDFVLFEGTQTALVALGAVGVTAASNISFVCQGVIGTADNSIGLLINGDVSFGAFINSLQGRGDNSALVVITGEVDDIFMKADQITLAGDGSTGFLVMSSHLTALDINSDVFKFGGINQTFFEYDTVNSGDLCDLNISTVESDSGGGAGGYSGSKGIVVKNGDLKVRIGSLVAETFVEVESGGRLSLQGNAAKGNTIIKDGGICVYDSLSLIDGDLNTEGTGLLQTRVSNIVGNATLADTSTMSIKSDRFIGEIVVGEFAKLFALIDVYTGTIPPNDGRVNGIIGGQRQGNWQRQLMLRAVSLVDQPAGALDDDTPLQITFGAAQGSASDPVQLLANGDIVFNKGQQYCPIFDFQIGRTGEGGVAWIFLRFTLDGVQIDEPILRKLNGMNDDSPLEIKKVINATAGQVLRVHEIRDSQGNNSGGLVTETPSVAGWTMTPSAAVSIWR